MRKSSAWNGAPQRGRNARGKLAAPLPSFLEGDVFISRQTEGIDLHLVQYRY